MLPIVNQKSIGLPVIGATEMLAAQRLITIFVIFRSNSSTIDRFGGNPHGTSGLGHLRR